MQNRPSDREQPRCSPLLRIAVEMARSQGSDPGPDSGVLAESWRTGALGWLRPIGKGGAIGLLRTSPRNVNTAGVSLPGVSGLPSVGTLP